jgi:F-type H+-transporting ATPase subunit a
VPFLRSGTADINTTLALSMMVVLGSNFFGIIAVGLWKTFNKYVNLKVLGSIFTKVRKDPAVLIVAPITFFVGLLELLGELAKIASLSFRLFGNVFAGEVLLASMSAIFAFVVPGPFLFLEVFVGLIQALIFSLLATVYFTIASQDHSESDEHEENEVEKEIEGKLVSV